MVIKHSFFKEMQGPQDAGKAVYSLSLRAGRGLRTAAAGIRASSIPLALHANC